MFLNIVAEVFCAIKGAMIVPSQGITRLVWLRVIGGDLVSSKPPDMVVGAACVECVEASDVRYWLLMSNIIILSNY